MMTHPSIHFAGPFALLKATPLEMQQGKWLRTLNSQVRTRRQETRQGHYKFGAPYLPSHALARPFPSALKGQCYLYVHTVTHEIRGRRPPDYDGPEDPKPATAKKHVSSKPKEELPRCDDPHALIVSDVAFYTRSVSKVSVAISFS